MGALDKGTDIIAHSVRDQDVDQRLITTLKTRNVGYIPTLTRDLSVFVYETRPAFFDDPFFLRGIALYRKEVDALTDPARQARTRNDKQAQAIKPALQQAMKNLKALSDAGVPIAMGTDSGAANNPGRWQGYFEHVELEYMVQAGLTPMQALVAATGGAARVMKLDERGHDSARKMGGSAGPDRGSARRHPQHAADPLGLDRRPSSGAAWHEVVGARTEVLRYRSIGLPRDARSLRFRRIARLDRLRRSRDYTT